MKRVTSFVAVASMCVSAFGATYYVDPTGGDVSSDDYDGTKETWEGGLVGPKKTLAAVMTVATNKNDVVIALPGEYKEKVSNESSIGTGDTLNRVTIPANVTLKSRDGAEKTIIFGEAAPDPDANGCGLDAVRCASVGSGARLVGFTLTGGRTSASGDNTNKSGAGVVGSGIVVDCIISNNYAKYRGGGAYYISCCRCRFTGNGAASSVGVGMAGNSSSPAIHCFFGTGCGTYNTKTVGCTFKGSAFPRGSSHYNTAIEKVSGSSNNDTTTFYRCAIGGKPAGTINYYRGTFETTSDALAIDADGRLRPGSVALQAGNYDVFTNQVAAEWRNLDLFWQKRISNGQLDIGCFEYDWYDEFSTALSSVGAAEVTNASSAVTLESGALNLPAATEVSVLLKPLGAGETDYAFCAEVTGSGTLSVYLDGAAEPAYSFTEASGAAETRLSISAETDARFVYVGEDGGAKLSKFSNSAYAIVLAGQNGVAIDGGVSFGTNIVASGQSATFTISRAYDSDVACMGVNVNGEFYAFDGHPEGYTFTVAGSDRNSSLAIEAVYREGARCWYVDANGGDDSNTGLYTNHAFRTLKTAVENDRYVAGEVIWVYPGDYNEGVCTNDEGIIKSRAALSEGMALRSVEGAEKTIIRGAADPNAGSSASGCGADAVRCLYMQDNSRAVGFTLTDGHAPKYSNDDDVRKIRGGAMYAASASGAMLVDCIASNNYARAGGAFTACTVVRGRVYKNGGAVGTDAFSGVTFIDTYFANNSGSYNVYSSCTCYNSTFDNGGGLGPRHNNNLYNCLLRNSKYSDDCNSKFYNCIYVTTPPGTSTYTDCTLTNADAIAIGSDFRPLAGSAAIDAGVRYAWSSNAVVSAGFESLDLFGGQRVYNGRIDVGCGEYDWRDDFARTLAERGVTVDASENVTTNAAAGLDVPSGQSLKMKILLKAGGDVSFLVQTETPESVSVLVDGVETEIGEAGRIAFNADAGEHAVEIACQAGAAATVSGVTLPRLGLLLLVE